MAEDSTIPVDAATPVTSTANGANGSGSHDGGKGPAPMTEAEYSRKTARRHELISKKFHTEAGLTEVEQHELETLQLETDAYVDWRYPLPFDVLEQAESIAVRIREELKRKSTESGT